MLRVAAKQFGTQVRPVQWPMSRWEKQPTHQLNNVMPMPSGLLAQRTISRAMTDTFDILIRLGCQWVAQRWNVVERTYPQSHEHVFLT